MIELIRTFAELGGGAQVGLIIIVLICWWGIIQTTKALRVKQNKDE